MDIKKLYRLPFLAVLGGEIALFMIIIVTGNLGQLSLRLNLNPFIITLLAVCIGMLIFSLLAFIQKYTYNPNRLKLNVLIAIASLAATVVLLLMNFTLTASDTSPASATSQGFLIDAGTIAFLVMAYHFVLFGIDVLISPPVEIRLNVVKLVLDILLLTAYYMNFTAEILYIGGRMVASEWLNETGDAIAYVLYFTCAVLLAIMVFRSIALERKATDPRGKAGFRSWSVIFFLIIIDIFFILVFAIIEEISVETAELVIIFGIGLLAVTTVCSYFIYKGFIAPSSTRPS